jgi:hypothetical protein
VHRNRTDVSNCRPWHHLGQVIFPKISRPASWNVVNIFGVSSNSFVFSKVFLNFNK